MLKRAKRPSASVSTSRPAPPRDPITRAARICEFVALGLVAAALFLKYPNGTLPPNSPPISLSDLSTTRDKILFVAAHTRAPWVILAILSTVIAVAWYRTRHREKRSAIVTLSPIAALVILALHAIAQGILQSQGVLNIQVHHAQGISRIIFAEGTGPQWQTLFAGDILFSAPILMAWFLSRILRRRRLAQV